jgi:hypothetical protein
MISINKTDLSKARAVVKKSELENTIHQCHENRGHPGSKETIHFFSTKYYFPGI